MIKGGGRRDHSPKNWFSFILTWKDMKQRPICFFLFLRLSFKMDEMAVLPRQSGSLIQQMLLCTPSTGKGFISGCPLS